MKLTLGFVIIAVVAVLVWLYSPISPDERQSLPETESVERGDANKSQHENALPDNVSAGTTAPAVAAGTHHDGTWGELVKFYLNREGCDTETIGVNTQIPCTANFVADHPYEQLSDDQLRQIADHDGIAALVLGARLGYRRASVEELRESINLLHAAVALTGHVDALNMLMTQLDVTSATSFVNGKIDIGQMSKAYVWHKTGNNLGLISDKVVDRIAQPLRGNDAVNLAALNAAAEERTEWFKVRRQTLTGESF